MHDQFQPSRGDFGNFQLGYDIAPSSEFAELEYIDENYVASLLFKAPGVNVSFVATATQLEVWNDYLELSIARGGAYMETLPIMRTRKADEHLHVDVYKNKLSFRNGAMFISIDISDCLKEFTNYINSIWRKLDEKEDRW